MRTPKRVAIAVSGLALAGSTALTLGAALPASAQTPQTTVPATSSHVATDGWGWGWGDGGWGWSSSWSSWGGWDGCGCW